MLFSAFLFYSFKFEFLLEENIPGNALKTIKARKYGIFTKTAGVNPFKFAF